MIYQSENARNIVKPVRSQNKSKQSYNGVSILKRCFVMSLLKSHNIKLDFYLEWTVSKLEITCCFKILMSFFFYFLLAIELYLTAISIHGRKVSNYGSTFCSTYLYVFCLGFIRMISFYVWRNTKYYIKQELL